MINTSLKELSAQLALKKISSVELTQTFLGRIRELNPKLNAFITIDENKSLAQAQAADAEAVAPSPPRQPIELLSATVTQPAVALPTAIPTATPMSRQALGLTGRPTSTPILLARVPATGSNGLRSSGAPAQQVGEGHGDAADYVPPDRHFSPALLPGYASCLFTAALLLVAGFVVTRRRAQVGREG